MENLSILESLNRHKWLNLRQGRSDYLVHLQSHTWLHTSESMNTVCTGEYTGNFFLSNASCIVSCYTDLLQIGPTECLIVWRNTNYRSADRWSESFYKSESRRKAAQKPPFFWIRSEGLYLSVASFCLIAASVAGVTLPSAAIPAAVWNFITARRVAGP